MKQIFNFIMVLSALVSTEAFSKAVEKSRKVAGEPNLICKADIPQVGDVSLSLNGLYKKGASVKVDGRMIVMKLKDSDLSSAQIYFKRSNVSAIDFIASWQEDQSPEGVTYSVAFEGKNEKNVSIVYEEEGYRGGLIRRQTAKAICSLD